MNWNFNRISQFVLKTLIAPLTLFLKNGSTPEKLAAAVAWGIVLGIFPVLGVTTVLCAIASLVFRLNMAAIQMANYFVAPLQLILLIPFIRFGEMLFGQPSMPFDVPQIILLVQSDILHAGKILWRAVLSAIAVWIVVAPVAFFVIRLVLLQILTHRQKVMGSSNNNLP